MRCDVLIGPTLQVCEFTLQFVLGNSPPANLISYKYESGILLGKFVEFFLTASNEEATLESNSIKKLVHQRVTQSITTTLPATL